MSNNTIQVVVCERDEASLQQLESALPTLGRDFDCHLARNPRELQATLEKAKPALVLCSQNIPDLVIQEVYSQVTQHAPKAKIIAIAAEMRPGVLTEAIKNGARDVITRDNLSQLAVVVARELDMLEDYRIHLHDKPASKVSSIDANQVHLDDGIIVACGAEVMKLVDASTEDDVVGTLILDYCEAAYLDDVRQRIKAWARGNETDAPLEVSGITTQGNRLPLNVTYVQAQRSRLGQMTLRIEAGEKKPKTTPTESTPPDEPKRAAQGGQGGQPPSPARRVLAPEDNPWIAKLQHALQHDDFALASQRITALGEGSAPDDTSQDHIDILIRMFLRLKDQGAEVSAGSFMSSAKQAGLLPDIDRWVIGHACDLLSQHYGQDRHPLFFLRISPDSLSDSKLVPWLESKLKDSKAPPQSLSFELPETEVIEHIDDSLPTLKKLKDMGCHLTLSHFGSTNQSDMLLDSMPVNYVKLHPNDVRSIGDNAPAVERVSNIVQRMHGRSVATIAPQVERAAQLAALWQCGVDYAQGYYMKLPEIVLTSSYRHKDEAQ